MLLVGSSNVFPWSEGLSDKPVYHDFAVNCESGPGYDQRTMGVDYIASVVPKERSYRPNAQQIANFANELRNDAYRSSVRSRGYLRLTPGPAEETSLRLPRYSGVWFLDG